MTAKEPSREIRMRRVVRVLPLEICAWLAAAGAVLLGSLAAPILLNHFNPSQPEAVAPPSQLDPAPEASQHPGQSVNRENKAARETGRAGLRDARRAQGKVASKPKATAADEPAPAQTGRASWYKIAAKTASGEAMDSEALTAAHPSLPIGTIVLVENLANGRSVRVRINDRGPFTGNRIIDVSQAAAEELDMIADGIATVRVSPVPEVMTAGVPATR
jgi:rare lipoprotein A